MNRFLSIMLLIFAYPSGVIFPLGHVFEKSQPRLFHFEGHVWLPGRLPAKNVGVVFKDHVTYQTTTTDEGSFSAELPLGVYRIVIDPSHQLHFNEYKGPIFSVDSPLKLTEQVFLRPRVDCVPATGGVSCGRAETFPIPSKDGVPFEVLIEYFSRQKTGDRYVYNADDGGLFGYGPISLYYNLFFLQADNIEFDVRTHDVIASGHVSGNNGSATILASEMLKVHLENGQASTVASPEK